MKKQTGSTRVTTKPWGLGRQKREHKGDREVCVCVCVCVCVEKTGTATDKTGEQITPQTTEHTLTRNKQDPDKARELYE